MDYQLATISGHLSAQTTIAVVLSAGLLLLGWGIISYVTAFGTQHIKVAFAAKSAAKPLFNALDLSLKTLLIINIAHILDVISITTLYSAALSGIVALGLTLQGSLSNFTGWVMISLCRPIRVGDYIETQGYEGTIKHIGLFTTKLEFINGQPISVPNGSLAYGYLINHSRNETRFIELTINVNYNDYIDGARPAMEKALKNDPRVLADKGNIVALKRVCSSSADFLVRVLVKTNDYWPLQHDIQHLLKTAIQNAGAGTSINRHDRPF